MSVMELTAEELARFDWQMALPGFGLESQLKLKAATALVTRVGGVGGPTAQMLAMAGVGRLILAHGGHVEAFHMNRMVLADHASINKRSPAVPAAERLRQLSPTVELVVVEENVSPENVERLVGEADIVMDGAPYFEERHLLNQECVKQRKPLVEAVATGMEGYVTSIVPGQTTCLACLNFHNKEWKLPFPILGAVSCAIGSMAALEGVKLLTGFGTPLLNTLLFFDGSDTSMRRVKVRRKAGCPVCGHLS